MKQTKTHIYCLFSIKNEYDQPDYNLEIFWNEKPGIEFLMKYFNVNIEDNNKVLEIVNLWQGKETRIQNTCYRVRKVEEGKGVGAQETD
jgi:hypothetical protein